MRRWSHIDFRADLGSHVTSQCKESLQASRTVVTVDTRWHNGSSLMDTRPRRVVVDDAVGSEDGIRPRHGSRPAGVAQGTRTSVRRSQTVGREETVKGSAVVRVVPAGAEARLPSLPLSPADAVQGPPRVICPLALRLCPRPLHQWGRGGNGRVLGKGRSGSLGKRTGEYQDGEQIDRGSRDPRD